MELRKQICDPLHRYALFVARHSPCAFSKRIIVLFPDLSRYKMMSRYVSEPLFHLVWYILKTLHNKYTGGSAELYGINQLYSYLRHISIGHFQIAFSLFLKTSLSAQTFTWK